MVVVIQLGRSPTNSPTHAPIIPAEGRITDWLRTIRMESCNILSSFFFSTQEIVNGSYFRPSDGPEKFFWGLWVHGQHSKRWHATDLGDLDLQPLAQTA